MRNSIWFARFVVFSLFLIPGLASILLPRITWASTTTQWHDPARDYRVSVVVQADGYTRLDKPAEIAVNFTTLLQSVGAMTAFDENSIHVIEVTGSGALVDGQVDYQFDAADDFDASTNATGTLVFLMEGETPANGARSYQIYFDVVGKGFTAAMPTPLVTFTPFVPDKGQNSFKIETRSGTYYYQLAGGGFSSLDDVDGNDWISYDTVGQAVYRGIPNMIHPQGAFHPGGTGTTTSLVSQGPLKVTYRSVYGSGATQWEALWEIYPDYARMTLLKAGQGFWFLYEGTPGGVLESSDYSVLSDGTTRAWDQAWCRDEGELADTNTICAGETGDWGQEWAYFVDPNVGAGGRALFLAHHVDDQVVDYYRKYRSATYPMTVFGFGRYDDAKKFSAADVPQQFTFGLMDQIEFDAAATQVRSAYMPLAVVIGDVEESTPVPSTIVTDSFNVCTLDEDVWTFTAPQAGGAAESTLRMTGVQAEIHVPGGIAHDIWTAGNLAPRLLQAANNTNFEIDVKFDTTVVAAVQMQGLLAVENDENFIRINVQHDGSSTRLVGIRFIDGAPTVEFNEAISEQGAPVYLRLRRTGLEWHVWHSFDGQSWSDIGGKTVLYHSLALTEIGVFAGNAGANPPAFTSRIDYLYRTDEAVNPTDTRALTLENILASVDPAGPLRAGTVAAEPVCGDPMTLVATPESGWRFERWTGNSFSSTDNPLSRAFDLGEQVTAYFVPTTLTLELNVVNTAGGTVTRTPQQTEYEYGQEVTLTAAPQDGWAFAGWSGDVQTGDLTTKLTMDKDKSVTATFKQLFTLASRAEPAAGGTVTSNVEGSPYIDGTVVELTAVPSPGWAFAGWTGDISGTENPLAVTMTEDRSITAVFRQLRSLSLSNDGEGTVTVDGDTTTYPDGSTVQVTAVPSAGWTFVNWAGDVSGSDNPLVLTIDSDLDIVAVFKRTFALLVSASGDGSVSVAPTKDQYVDGDTVALTPLPGDGQAFVGWAGDASGRDVPLMMTMDSDKSIIARFEPGLSLGVTTIGQGTVVLDPVMPAYVYGALVSAQATPTQGWRFDHWAGALESSQNPVQVVMNNNKVLTAVFVEQAASRDVFLPIIHSN